MAFSLFKRFFKYTSYIVLFFLFARLPGSPIRECAALTGAGLTPEVEGFSDGTSGITIEKSTGSFSWSLPILNVPARRDSGYQISLSYAPGIKANEQASWVGLGFNLGPGAIYRQVAHIPDDYYDGDVKQQVVGDGAEIDQAFNYIYYNSDYRVAIANNIINIIRNLFSKPKRTFGPWGMYGYLHFNRPESKGSLSPSSCGRSCLRREYSPPFELDSGQYRPSIPPVDTYLVVGPGPSGALTPWRSQAYEIRDDGSYNNDVTGEVRFYLTSHQGKRGSDVGGEQGRSSAVKVSHSLFPYSDPLHPGQISSFTLTDVDGTRYVYGRPVYETTGALGCDGNCGNDESSSFELLTKYAYAWYLTQILSPDYLDSNGDGQANSEDLGNWISFEYTTHSTDYFWAEPYGYGTYPTYNTCPGDRSYSGEAWRESVRMEDDPNNEVSRSWGVKELAYLSTITTPTHEAIFHTSQRLDGKEANADYGSPWRCGGNPNEFPRRLDQIELKDNTNSSLFSVNFSYDYSLRPGQVNSTAPAQGSLTLTSVSLPSGTSYAFDYGTATSCNSSNGTSIACNPTWHANDWDRWGYYCASCSWGIHSPNPQYGYLDPTAWSLDRIWLPGGGSLQMEYEANIFSKLEQYSLETLAPNTLGGPQMGGGIRLRQLTTDDGRGNESKTRYVYNTDSFVSFTDLSAWGFEKSPGVVRALPPFYEIKPNETLDYLTQPFSSFTVYYSKVIEIPGFIPENIDPQSYRESEPFGRVVYEFTTPADFSDHDQTLNPPTYNNTDLSYTETVRYRSRANAWGKLKSKTIYDVDRNEKSQVRNVWTDSFDRRWSNWTDRWDHDYFNYYDIWGWSDLTASTETKDGISMVRLFTYDDVNGLPSEISEYYTDASTPPQKRPARKSNPLLQLARKRSWLYDFTSGSSTATEALTRNMLSLVATESSWGGLYLGESLLSEAKTEYVVNPLGQLVPKRVKARRSDGSYLTLKDITNWDDFGNVQRELNVDGIEKVDTYSADGNSLMSSVIGNTFTTSYQYSDPKFKWKLTSATLPSGVSTSYSYDASGRLKSKDAGDLTATFDYYLTQDCPVASSLSCIKTTLSGDTLGSDRVTYNIADGLGRKIITRSEGDSGPVFSQVSFDPLGRIDKSYYPYTSSAGDYKLTQYEPAEEGRPIASYPNYSTRPALNAQTSYSWGSTPSNYLNFLQTETDPLGVVTERYSHPLALQNVVKKEADNGLMVQISNTTYDFMGNPTEVVDGDGRTTYYRYDEFNRKLTARKPDMTTFSAVSYPSFGQVTEEWAYDNAGRITRFRDSNLALSRNDSNQPEPKHIEFTYDGFGRLIRKQIYRDSGTAVSGTAVLTQYDTYNGPACEFVSGNFLNHHLSNQASLSHYVERALGKITCEKESNGLVTAYFYDNNDRVGAKLYYVPVLLPNEQDSGMWAFYYSYNGAGQLTERTLEADTDVMANFSYNRLGQLDEVTVNGASEALLDYTVSGQIDKITRPQIGVETDYNYDDLLRLTNIDNSGIIDSSKGLKRSYTYDDLNRITMITHDLDFQASTPTNLVLADYSSGYDTFGRLTDGVERSLFVATENNFQYSYDNSNNRTRKSTNSNLDIYNYLSGTNRLSSINFAAGNTYSFGYDYNGNTSSLLDSSGQNTQIYRYNHWDQLEQISFPSGAWQIMLFDGERPWRKQQSDGDYWLYFHEGNDIVADTEPLLPGDANGDGHLSISDPIFLINYIFGGGDPPALKSAADADGNGILTISDAVYMISYIFGGGPPPESPISRIFNGYLRLNGQLFLKYNQQGEKTYFLNDHIGSPAVILNSAGREVTTHSYSAFGERSGGNTTRFGFTSKEWDSSTRQYSFGPRNYDPSLGRFLQADKLPGEHPYTYVGNNPVTNTDPSGHGYVPMYIPHWSPPTKGWMLSVGNFLKAAWEARDDLASIGVSLIPAIGECYDGACLISGGDLITGEEYTKADKIFGAIGLGSLAASSGSVIAARRGLVKITGAVLESINKSKVTDFLAKYKPSISEDLYGSFLKGVKLGENVTEGLFQEGQYIGRWVRSEDASNAGNWAAHLTDADPARLGMISTDEAVFRVFRVKQPFPYLESVAADLPNGIAGAPSHIGGSGGGLQYLLPDDWLNYVEQVSP